LIGRLTGKVVEEAGDGSLLLDVAGVGYEVAAPLGTLGRASTDAVGAVVLHVHTHVREDALSLYGFATADDKAAFRSLISVSNVGPKIALSILSALTASELALVVTRAETAKLTAVPGVGKKTAERLVLELKDKLSALAQAHRLASAAATKAAPATSQAELLLRALTGMGFRATEADRAVAALGTKVDSAPMGELVRDALAVLAR
jgi:Holliday junction DNA helicase RuvA